MKRARRGISRGIHKRLAFACAAAVVATATTAAAGWDLPDPTRPSYIAGGDGLTLQSIIVSPGRRLAVIDGRAVKIGDRVGGAVVIDIRPYEVRLRRGGKEIALPLLSPLATKKKQEAP